MRSFYSPFQFSLFRILMGMLLMLWFATQASALRELGYTTGFNVYPE